MGVAGGERGIVDAAHPAGILVTDIVRSGAKAELEGSIGGQLAVSIGG